MKRYKRLGSLKAKLDSWLFTYDSTIKLFLAWFYLGTCGMVLLYLWLVFHWSLAVAWLMLFCTAWAYTQYIRWRANPEGIVFQDGYAGKNKEERPV